jgi:hypothetical protein
MKKVLLFLSAFIITSAINTSAVGAVQDVTAPLLTSLTFTPSTIDTSNGPATISFSISGNDDLSGIRAATFALRLGNRPIASVAGKKVGGGTEGNSTWEGSFIVHQYSPQGSYSVSVQLFDTVNNFSTFTVIELKNAGFPHWIRNGITEAPKIQITAARRAGWQKGIEVQVDINEIYPGSEIEFWTKLNKGKWKKVGFNKVRWDFYSSYFLMSNDPISIEARLGNLRSNVATITTKSGK